MRKLTTAAAVSLALTSAGVQALGLGNIEMRSALNQPMDAAIRLTSVGPGELDGIIVQLAPPEAFARAGIERTSLLTDLDFAVDNSGKEPVIRVTSKRPILEPFLNFLVEVDWPDGRLVREYTVLLDPPVFMSPDASGRNTADDTPARVTEADNALLAPAPIDRQASRLDVEQQSDAGQRTAAGGVDAGDVLSLNDPTGANPAAEARAEAAEINRRRQTARQRAGLPEVELRGGTREVPDDFVAGRALELNPIRPRIGAGGQAERVELDGASQAEGSAVPAEYEVKRGDTLYEIADATRARSTTVQQMMLALLNANERAFIQRNINLVKAGSILRIPASADQRVISQVEAVAEISRQADLWREYRESLRQATRVARAPEPAAESSVEDSAGATSADAAGANDETGLSADAQAILDQAREETRGRDELQIVADPASSATAASATADETADSDTQRLGEINRDLKLAREELSSARLAGEDLNEAAAELASTEENLDTLVSLTQNEIAALEARLAESRRAATASGTEAAANEATAGPASVDEAAAAAGIDQAEAPDAAGDDSASALLGTDARSQAESIADSDDGSAPLNSGDASEALAESTRTDIDIDAPAETLQAPAEDVGEAVTAAGQTLGDVERLDEGSESARAAADSPAPLAPEQTQPWYENLLTDRNKLAVAGVGGLGLIGLVSLLMRRRRATDDFDELDEVEYIDDNEAGNLQAELDGSSQDAAEATASAAAATAATGEAEDGPTAPIDHEKVLSEADVYIAYGLHGQAEELLVKAIADDPDNQDYVIKLLETHHAQGNLREFGDAASTFHSRFGGQANPSWPAIAAMGRELEPGSSLYAHADEDRADDDTPAVEDFADTAATDMPAASVALDPEASVAGTRDQEAVQEPADEALLMDESLDPGFAFDESDLEATGDFSAIADEVVAEEASGATAVQADDELIEFAPDEPTLAAATASPTDELAADALDSDTSHTSGLEPSDQVTDHTLQQASDEASIDEPAFGIEHGTRQAETDVQDHDDATLGDLDGLDLSTPVADDLTLDIEQLTEEMDLDSADLLSDDFLNTDDLKLAEFDSDQDGLLAPGSDAVSDADDLDTMMDLAKAYIDMGDKDSASNALDEIVKSGNPEQVSEAETLLRKIS